jgi:hypothetical protein
MATRYECGVNGEEDKRDTRQKPGGFATFFSVALAVLLALLLPLSLLAWDIYRTVFNPPLMQTVLTDIVTNSDLIPVALEWYANVRAELRAETTTAIPWVDGPDIIELLAILDVDDWRAERFEALPNEILTPWVLLPSTVPMPGSIRLTATRRSSGRCSRSKTGSIHSTGVTPSKSSTMRSNPASKGRSPTFSNALTPRLLAKRCPTIYAPSLSRGLRISSMTIMIR